jgi:hypothetical protein
MTNKYNIYINCVVLSTDIPDNKQFVLSTSENSIEFPNFACNNDFLNSPEIYLANFLKEYIFVNDAELLPQLVSIDTKYISDNNDRVDMIYGFVTTKTNSISKNANWFEFSYQQPNPYSNILFEVTQKLK